MIRIFSIRISDPHSGCLQQNRIILNILNEIQICTQSLLLSSSSCLHVSTVVKSFARRIAIHDVSHHDDNILLGNLSSHDHSSNNLLADNSFLCFWFRNNSAICRLMRFIAESTPHFLMLLRPVTVRRFGGYLVLTEL